MGDIHLENYGTWRDGEGRLAWGVNDYDEAAAMPWTLDLVRLVTSALLSPTQPGPKPVAKAVLQGYAAGLAKPRPHVLDQEPGPLRDAVNQARPKPGEDWWDDLEKQLQGDAQPGPRWRAALEAAT